MERLRHVDKTNQTRTAINISENEPQVRRKLGKPRLGLPKGAEISL
jgi:hypothetical protein